MSQGLYTVSYDISQDSRRVRIANVLKAYGERMQYSVFECYLSRRELLELRGRLERIIDVAGDSVRLYRVEGPVLIIGDGERYEAESLFIV